MAQIGDLIQKTGIYTKPGVVTKKNDDGTVKVDTDPMAINKYHRHANTSGLSPQEKSVFNEILDEVAQSGDKVTKINAIQNKIDKLQVDPNNRNVVQYLRNEQAHLVREAKNLPQTYTRDEASIRS